MLLSEFKGSVIMFRLLSKLTAFGFCTMALVACGGSDRTPLFEPTNFQTAVNTQTITVLRADGSTGQVLVSTETFGTLTLAKEQTYSGLLSNGSVAGLETLSADVPTAGTLTYSGSSSAVINDGVHFYELSGSSSATLTLTESSSDLDVTLSGFSGERTDAVTAEVTVVSTSDIEITWQDALLTGNRLNGGTVDITNTAATLSGSQIVNAYGVLFGPSGEELGGLISVDDASNLEVTAGFIAE